MDLRKLKTLVDLVSESNIAELEITEADGKVRIVKASAPMAMAAAPLVMTAPAMAAAATQVLPVSGAIPADGEDVEVGSEIKAGEPLCIIEAMKIMNEIEADVGGSITKVLAENGQAVEFGQPLFVIDRRG